MVRILRDFPLLRVFIFLTFRQRQEAELSCYPLEKCHFYS